MNILLPTKLFNFNLSNLKSRCLSIIFIPIKTTMDEFNNGFEFYTFNQGCCKVKVAMGGCGCGQWPGGSNGGGWRQLAPAERWWLALAEAAVPSPDRAKQSKQRRHGRTTAAAEHRRRLVAWMGGEEWPAVGSGTAQWEEGEEKEVRERGFTGKGRQRGRGQIWFDFSFICCFTYYLVNFACFAFSLWLSFSLLIRWLVYPYL